MKKLQITWCILLLCQMAPNSFGQGNNSKIGKAPIIIKEVEQAIAQETSQKVRANIELGKTRIGEYAKKLKQQLMTGLQEGADKAVKSCKDFVEQQQAHPTKRTSLKYRNPANKPNALFAEILTKMEKTRPKSMHLVKRGEARYLVKPIYVKPLCVTCHGSTIAKPIQAKLKQHYPKDRATQYQVGDFRGVFYTKL